VSTPSRLGEIYEGVASLIHDPLLDAIAIEQVLMARNASSALKPARRVVRRWRL
jgi:Holliday junction resolvasome RuvABC endonuclease subunit